MQSSVVTPKVINYAQHTLIHTLHPQYSRCEFVILNLYSFSNCYAYKCTLRYVHGVQMQIYVFVKMMVKEMSVENKIKNIFIWCRTFLKFMWSFFISCISTNFLRPTCVYMRKTRMGGHRDIRTLHKDKFCCLLANDFRKTLERSVF